MKEFHKTKKHISELWDYPYVPNFKLLLTILCCLVLGRHESFAEGIASIAPSDKDAAAIYVGAGNTGAGGGDYGLFGWKGSNSKLFFNIQNTCEKAFVGFSIPKTRRSYSNTNPSTGGAGFVEHLLFRIVAPDGQPIDDLACFGNTTFEGEVWQTLKMSDAKLTERSQAIAGPSQLVAGGYDAFELDLSACGLTQTGDYSIEFYTTNQFYNPNTSNAGFHIELFDITVTDCNNLGLKGRVWSNNWSLSIKLDGDGAFDRAFNGAFYVCSAEGFITKIDFNSRTNNRALAGKDNDQQSGFRAGSFNVSFNTTGPGSSGDILQDRLSLASINSPNPQLPVFLNLPDEAICPEQPIGQFQQMKSFVTGCADSRCINMATTQPGQLDILLERLNGNSALDQPEEFRIAYEIDEKDLVSNPETPGFNYQICIPWDGRDAQGNMWDINDLKISGFFRQGVYHFPSYDAEFNDDGFLVETVRPALGFQELYYDDTLIPESNNTGEPKDGSNGCDAPCHRWTGEWERFDDKDDVFGNFNTINTWWFGNTQFKEFQVTQVTLAISCPADFNGCFNSSTDPTVTGQPAEALQASECIQVNYSDVVKEDPSCLGGQLIERTWSSFLVGMENQRVECVQLIKIAGQHPPVFSDTPEDLTISCEANPPIPSVITALSSCENAAATIDFSETLLDGTCPNSSVIRRVWTATDACGNVSTIEQLITQSDTEGPTFIDNLPELRLDCDAPAPSASNLNVIDNCDDASTINITYTDLVSSETEGCGVGNIVIRTYTAVDQCGNFTTADQRIIFEDNTPPTLENIPANETVSCNAIPDPPNAIIAVDNCDSPTNISIDLIEEISPGTCGGNQILKRTWTATDGCGNMAQAQQLISIEDNTPPVLVGVPSNFTATCEDILLAPLNVMATDNCSNDVTIDLKEETVPGLCPGNSGLRRIWTATDDCGNSSTAEQFITIVDNTPPVFTECGKTIKVTAGIDCQLANVPIQPPTATDNCSAVTVTSSVDLKKSFSIGRNVVTFTAIDACGNRTTCEYIIQVDNAPDDSCPEDIIVSCKPNIDGAIVSWDPPNGNDCCSSCADETAIPGYTYLGLRGGHRYYLSDKKMDWHTAKDNAAALGGELAIINDPAENNYLEKLLDDDKSAFIGLSDAGSEGNFYWLDGSPLLYTNWLINQPNNKDGIQHYGQLLGNGLWNDAYVTNQFLALIEIVCVDVQQTSGPLNGSKFSEGTTVVAYNIDYDNCNNSDFCQFNVTVDQCPLRYCESKAKDATCFWIDRIAVADLDHSSENDGGYEDFTDLEANLTVGKTYTMLMKPGFREGHMYDLHWMVYIDYNKDGDFTDEGELVLTKFENRIFHKKGDGPVFKDFTIPTNVTLGKTRMRVSMKFTENLDPCDRFSFGEVQDYTVNLQPMDSQKTSEGIHSQTIIATTMDPGETILLEESPVTPPEISLSNDLATGQFSSNSRINLTLQLYPNPVRDGLSVKIEGFKDSLPTQHILKIYNHAGQIVHFKELDKAAQQLLMIDVHQLTNGLYFVVIESSDGRLMTKKFTKY